jgi:hypothetical protein
MRPTLIQSAALAGLSLLVAPACSTHYPGAFHHGGDYPEYGRGYERAYDRGYHHGVEAGAKDRRHNRHFDLWRHSRYRNAESGYNPRYGPRPSYCQTYRAGFRAGYEQGYRPWRGRRY